MRHLSAKSGNASLRRQVSCLMVSQLYMWRLEDFRRAWHLLQEPLVMQATCLDIDTVTEFPKCNPSGQERRVVLPWANGFGDHGFAE